MIFGSTRSRLIAAMNRASSYKQWSDAAIQHDMETGLEHWKKSDACESYDYHAIRHRFDIIRDLRLRRDYHQLLFTLNEGIHGNLGGMGKPSLYNKAKFGTKNLIHQYINELCEALEELNQAPADVISDEEKQDFFQRACHCYGRSALMLSGGGSLGFFHAGVVKALLHEGLLPDVMSGSSAGSIIAAIACTHRNEELPERLSVRNLQMDLAPSQPRGRSNLRPANTATVIRSIERWIPDLTFQEAYERTQRALNITVSGLLPNQAPRLLNAITSPNVTIRSAVQASSAVYGIYPPTTLEAKNAHGEKVPYLPDLKWIDGSFLDDLPAKRLARLYGVNHFISSMINPAVLMTSGNPDKREGLIDQLLQTQKRLLKSTAMEAVKLSHRFVRIKSPTVSMIQYLSYNALAQDYTADINLFPRQRRFNPIKLLSPPTQSDLRTRLREGELATWERIEMVRNCTSVSRTLDRIIRENGWITG